MLNFDVVSRHIQKLCSARLVSRLTKLIIINQFINHQLIKYGINFVIIVVINDKELYLRNWNNNFALNIFAKASLSLTYFSVFEIIRP